MTAFRTSYELRSSIYENGLEVPVVRRVKRTFTSPKVFAQYLACNARFNPSAKQITISDFKLAPSQVRTARIHA